MDDAGEYIATSYYDCLQETFAEAPYSCYSGDEIGDQLRVASKFAGSNKLYEWQYPAVWCDLVNINGQKHEDGNSPTLFPFNKTGPDGVTWCDAKYGEDSPFVQFAKYTETMKQFDVQAARCDAPGQNSGCQTLFTGKTGISPNDCWQKMQEKGGNAVNFRTGEACIVKKCSSQDLELRTRFGEYEVYSLICKTAESVPHGSISPRGSASILDSCSMCRSGVMGLECCSGGHGESGSKCRFPSGGFYNPAIPSAIVDELMDSNKDPGEACCSGLAVFAKSGQWECRDSIGEQDVEYQLRSANGAYRQHAFSQYMIYVYNNKVKPLEEMSLFSAFDLGPLTLGEINSKPMAMLCGGYSTGKTSFIRNIIGRDFPSMHIGVEPTTDTFTIVENGDEQLIPGLALANDPDQPFKALGAKLGTKFLHRFQASRVPSPVLRNISFIDTPGVLSGNKQSEDVRGYQFSTAIDWFARASDVILLFLDPSKLDISDELGQVIRIVHKGGNAKKLKVVLNKADLIPPDELMTVYGAVMWYLSQIIGTPEVIKVYMGNFGGFEYKYKGLADLFDINKEQLVGDLLTNTLPRQAALRKVNDLIERMRKLKAHVALLDVLRKRFKELNGFAWGKLIANREQLDERHENATQKLLEFIPEALKIAAANNPDVNKGDFMDVETLKQRVQHVNFWNVHKIEPEMVAKLEDAEMHDTPRLLHAASNTFASPAMDVKSDLDQNIKASGISPMTQAAAASR